ncbi:MAG TPA: hypothetical protein VFK47_01795 [Ktedonobacteraceae bacterium]|nr:hypothetical protein [Ktedonobacteraceae bacterium]
MVTQAPAGKAQQQIALRPFVTATKRRDLPVYDNTLTQSASTQTYPVFQVNPDGFLSALYIVVTATTSGNSANVAFNADAPFNVLQTIQFNDTGNNPVTGPMNGHDLYECIKFGGYSFSDDAKQSPVYSVTTGTGATGGSFTLVLRLPIEIVKRDGFGSVPNKSASATWKLNLTLAASTDVYSTPPTTLPSVRVQIQQRGYMDPNSTDAKGNPAAQAPPAVNTVQYWNKQDIVVNAGAMTNQKINSYNGYLRNLIFQLKDSNGSRQQGDSDFPAQFQLTYEVVQPINRLKTVWQHMIGESFGYTNAVETAGGRDYGVYPEWYTTDYGLKPGAETRFSYLPVTDATNLAMSGTIGGSGSHTLTVFTNYVVPSGDPRQMTGGK